MITSDCRYGNVTGITAEEMPRHSAGDYGKDINMIFDRLHFHLCAFQELNHQIVFKLQGGGAE